MPKANFRTTNVVVACTMFWGSTTLMAEVVGDERNNLVRPRSPSDIAGDSEKKKEAPLPSKKGLSWEKKDKLYFDVPPIKPTGSFPDPCLKQPTLPQCKDTNPKL